MSGKTTRKYKLTLVLPVSKEVNIFGILCEKDSTAISWNSFPVLKLSWKSTGKHHGNLNQRISRSSNLRLLDTNCSANVELHRVGSCSITYSFSKDGGRMPRFVNSCVLYHSLHNKGSVTIISLNGRITTYDIQRRVENITDEFGYDRGVLP